MRHRPRRARGPAPGRRGPDRSHQDGEERARRCHPLSVRRPTATPLPRVARHRLRVRRREWRASQPRADERRVPPLAHGQAVPLRAVEEPAQLVRDHAPCQRGRPRRRCPPPWPHDARHNLPALRQAERRAASLHRRHPRGKEIARAVEGTERPRGLEEGAAQFAHMCSVLGIVGQTSPGAENARFSTFSTSLCINC